MKEVTNVKEEIETAAGFLANLADYTTKIDYVIGQAEMGEGVPGENVAIQIIKDYNDKIIGLCDAFNDWMLDKDSNKYSSQVK